MPAYSSALPPLAVGFGESAIVINGENIQPSLPFKSAQAALAPTFTTGVQRISVEVAFAANPGAISWQLQSSDTDADANYVNEGSAVTTLNATFVSRLELSGVVARFARILVTAMANNVAVTAKISS